MVCRLEGRQELELAEGVADLERQIDEDEDLATLLQQSLYEVDDAQGQTASPTTRATTQTGTEAPSGGSLWFF